MANNLSLDMCLVPSWANPSGAPSRCSSVRKWRTALPLFSRELHITPEALPGAQVDVDGLLEPLSKGARAAWKNLRGKQASPSDTVTKNTEPAKETKTAFDNKHPPMPTQKLSRDMMRKQVSTTPSKEIDGKHEWWQQNKCVQKPKLMRYRSVCLTL